MQQFDCLDCAACCKESSYLNLNLEEVALLEAGGTQLVPILQADQDVDWSARKQRKSIGEEIARKVMDGTDDPFSMRISIYILRNAAHEFKKGDGLYKRNGRCGYLAVNNTCAIYEDRPRTCANFPPGGDLCVEIRDQHRRVQDQLVNIIRKPGDAIHNENDL
jgi:Fe-S-cluster containining protein